MSFTVECECPQCGGPVEIPEDDRFIFCPYCGVKSYLFVPGGFRLTFSHRKDPDGIFYVPYLRFKGNVYVCQGFSICHRIVDFTHHGAGIRDFPPSLGLKPQAMKMKTVVPESGGMFLRSASGIDDILTLVENHTAMLGSGPLFHRAYIGESFSTVYLPVYLKKGEIYDAVTGRFLAPLSEESGSFSSILERDPQWKISGFGSLCPQCDWELEGEGSSIALTCANCNRVWEVSEDGFISVDFGTFRGKTATYYVPFWRIEAWSEDCGLYSYRDFIQFTNQPRIVSKKQQEEPLFFWVPAFKIRPDIFLNLARQMTIIQKTCELEPVLPERSLYPVTLPQSEAIQSLKIILAAAAIVKNKIFPLLPSINFAVRHATLVYIPFIETVHEIVQEGGGISIYKKSMEYGSLL